MNNQFACIACAEQARTRPSGTHLSGEESKELWQDSVLYSPARGSCLSLRAKFDIAMIGNFHLQAETAVQVLNLMILHCFFLISLLHTTAMTL